MPTPSWCHRCPSSWNLEPPSPEPVGDQSSQKGAAAQGEGHAGDGDIAGVGVARNGVVVKRRHVITLGQSIVDQFYQDQTPVNGTVEAGVC